MLKVDGMYTSFNNQGNNLNWNTNAIFNELTLPLVIFNTNSDLIDDNTKNINGLNIGQNNPA